MRGNINQCAICITPSLLPYIFSWLGGITCGPTGQCIGYEVGLAAGQYIGNYSSLYYWTNAVGGIAINRYINENREFVKAIIVQHFELIKVILQSLSIKFNIEIQLPKTPDECIKYIKPQVRNIIRNVIYGLLTLIIPVLREQYNMWENAAPIPQEMEHTHEN